MTKLHQAPTERLVQAYNRMLERVKATITAAERDAIPTLRHNIENAKEKAVELGELSREEAAKLAEYLHRDVEEAGHYLAETGAELRDWFHFDVQLIEDKLLELLISAADRTKVELMALEQRARRSSEYHSGEITGIGTLKCVGCGQLVHFHTTGHIPPCPKCHGAVFQRPQGK